MARNTRFIASTHYTRWKHLRNLVWAIMAFNLVRVLFAEGAELIAVTASSEAPLMAVVSSLIVIFIETVFVSFFPIVGWYAFCTFMISRARRESTFTPVADIEYFREKLDGLAPATVSLLADLRIERRNDICASLLRLALDGAISLEGDSPRILDTGWRERSKALRASGGRSSMNGRAYTPSEELLMSTIENGGSFSSDKRVTKWEDLAFQEFLASGYVVEGSSSAPGTGCKGCGFGCLTFLVLGVIVAFIVQSPWFKEFETLADTLGSDPEIVQYMSTHVWLLIWTLLLTVLLMVTMIALQAPFLGLLHAFIEAGAMDWRFVRTAEGEELTECIYGLKNYIHEFTNLSEADKKALVLWDDFFVYAVALDENTHVVSQILGDRGIDFGVLDALDL